MPSGAPKNTTSLGNRQKPLVTQSPRGAQSATATLRRSTRITAGKNPRRLIDEASSAEPSGEAKKDKKLQGPSQRKALTIAPKRTVKKQKRAQAQAQTHISTTLSKRAPVKSRSSIAGKDVISQPSASKPTGTHRRAEPKNRKQQGAAQSSKARPKESPQYQPRRQSSRLRLNHWIIAAASTSQPPDSNTPPENVDIDERIANLPTTSSRQSDNENLMDHTPSIDAGTNQLSNRTPKSKNPAWEAWLGVRNTGIDKHQAKDWHTASLQEYIDKGTSYKTSKPHLQDLFSLIRNFLKHYDIRRHEAELDVLYKEVEEFRTTLQEQFYKLGFFGLNDEDFNFDLLSAQKNNEAYVQRTIMIHSASHWRLSDLFVPVFEQGWNNQTPRLPTNRRENVRPDVEDAGGPNVRRQTRGNNKNKAINSNQEETRNLATPSNQDETGPKGSYGGGRFKTDMAICFREDRMCDDEYDRLGILPHRQDLAVFPDEVLTRCFPFLFIEAKKSFGDMTLAQHTSLYAASRALYNIFVCMKRTGTLPEFFMNVRTFSIIIQPESFKAFIHRAIWHKKREEMHFVFDQLYEKLNYNRNDISAVVQVIVDRFARDPLFQLLRKTYQGLVTQSRHLSSPQAQATATGWDEFERRFNEEKGKSYEEFLRPALKRKAAEQYSQPRHTRYTDSPVSQGRESSRSGSQGVDFLNSQPVNASFFQGYSNRNSQTSMP